MNLRLPNQFNLAGETEFNVLHTSGQQVTDKPLFPCPMAQVVGLEFDPKQKARVKSVANGSSTEKDGFKAGDEILTFEGQPMQSIADVQWVMKMARTPAKEEVSWRQGADDRVARRRADQSGVAVAIAEKSKRLYHTREERECNNQNGLRLV